MLPIYYHNGPSGELNKAKLEPIAPRHWRLRSIWVWYSCRRMGIGNALLERITHDADIEGVTLELQIAGWSDKAMNDWQLLSWYKRHGFMLKAKWEMIRTPKNRMGAMQETSCLTK